MTRAVLTVLAWLAGITAASADTRVTHLTFDDLQDWALDDHAEAFDAFLVTCGDLRDAEWSVVCDVARSGPDPRGFFEMFFIPVLIEDGTDALFTGYYEPELDGSLVRGGPYQFPIHAVPAGLPETGPWLTRREIDEGGLDGQDIEIAYLTDPVDQIFLQIQGSGRIRLPSGETIRVGYGANNRHPYSSLGAELVRRGEFEPHQVSASVIRDWVRANPTAGRDLLWTNANYVFFREVSEVPSDRGPLGAMNRSVTPMRTLAVDPAYVPLGAPVWMEKGGADPLNRLMVAQDTGSAIKGAQRSDVFFGTGDVAGRDAGRIRDPGRLVVLLPIQIAFEVQNAIGVGG